MRRGWGSAAGWVMRIMRTSMRNKYRLIMIMSQASLASLGTQRVKLKTIHCCLHPGKYPPLSQFLSTSYWTKEKLMLKPSENWETLERKLNWKIFLRCFNRSNLQLLKRNLLTSGRISSILSCYYRNWYLLFQCRVFIGCSGSDQQTKFSDIRKLPDGIQMRRKTQVWRGIIWGIVLSNPPMLSDAAS